MQQFACFRERAGALMIGEQSIVSNAMKAAWMNMQEKAAHELVRRQRHGLITFARGLAIVLPLEGDVTFIAVDEATVSDGDAVGVTREVFEYGLRSGEGSLGIDDPFDSPQRCEEGAEGMACCRRRRIEPFPRCLPLLC